MEKEKYRLLKEGEEFQVGDEMNYMLGTGWKPIPETWIGSKFSHKDNNTLSRQKIPVRRKK